MLGQKNHINSVSTANGTNNMSNLNDPMSGVAAKPKTAIILDIDQCLVNSFIADEDPVGSKMLLTESMRSCNVDSRSRMMSMSFYMDNQWWDFCAVKRPYLDLFLTKIRSLFDLVIVWTAGSAEYAQVIVTEIFRDHYKPDFLLTRDDVVTVPEWPPGQDYHKPLDVIEAKYPGLIDRRFTVFVDDTKRNFTANLENGVIIPRFEPHHSDPFKISDAHLLQLTNWLCSDEVRNSPDIRKINKDLIFSDISAQVSTPSSSTDLASALPHRMSFTARTSTRI